MDDKRIISLYFDRDEQAIAETDKKYGGVCRHISHNIVGNSLDAEECVNDTYLAAWNTIPPTRPNPFSAFLYKIARNLSVKRYTYNTAAKRNSYYDTSFEELSECLPCPKTDDRLTPKMIEDFLDSLSAKNRVIFLRRYWFSDSYEDIARRTGLGVKAVSMRLTRIREGLRAHLKKEGIEI